AIIHWSIVGTKAERSKAAHALEDARGHVQSLIAAVMHTRVTPIIRFEFDESVEGTVRLGRLLDELRAERDEDETEEEEASED
ncbi:MAG: hypothetical protein O7A63_09740, partial [Acidobacteria bacterium]|nr:hypothetical protein [Acidobacteriota bacterium]